MFQQSQNKPAAKGIKRWISAFNNSLNGVKHAFKHEAAMREEMIAFIISLPVAAFIAQNVWHYLVLIFSVLFVLLVETLNTAIETTLDRISTEFNEMTGFAKDLGSFAVLIATIIAIGVWLVSLYYAIF
ncbi:diacylglycerol kinase [Vibrio sp. SS-MA-C1-2]|uniref:diacylglycerol kinase n=1 Tax=Vibrio sp. SS-MA-C1-2 TaxID=2908646 RepID=UPI001F232F07|nr:diacylglycerol kinase [Vibrio sp. SS-MA-C1-2]UJF17880.1 diacylglycerol kinase [Vibrio sp. SS-MA-C1-2]